MLLVRLPVHIEGELNERAEALVARSQRLLGAPALRDVPHDGNDESAAVVRERTDTDLDRKHAAVLATVTGLEREGFAGVKQRDLRLGRRSVAIRGRIELTQRPPDQLVPE